MSDQALTHPLVMAEMSVGDMIRAQKPSTSRCGWACSAIRTERGQRWEGRSANGRSSSLLSSLEHEKPTKPRQHSAGNPRPVQHHGFVVPGLVPNGPTEDSHDQE